ncbi:MAG: HlyD family type I secretion periplasmic adaptor subunit [Magnetococcales bacterium]|nr:HlyD family type I secretion periplasmic adaptor subunit [Magnetococcales bacterium]
MSGVEEPVPPFGELDPDSSRASRRFLWAVFLVVAILVAWGHYGTLDIISITQGEVVPSSLVKKVQHLEGGIVREILVHEGEVVQRDQPLVELESTASGADVGELQARVTALRVEIIRLEAEAAGKDELAFTAGQIEEFGEQRVRQAREQFQSRRVNLKNAITGQSETVVQRQHDIQEIQARLRNAQKRSGLLKEQVDISEKLLKNDISSRYGHLDLLKELSAVQSRIEEDTSAVARAEAMLKEANAQLKMVRSRFDEEVSKQLEAARRDLSEHQARLGKFEDSFRRTQVKSPVQGVVKSLNVATLGGVIRAGETILEIVPEGDELVIEAKLPIHDIGYVSVGQQAKIRLISSDAARFGELDGQVVNVSPDTFVIKEGNPYYKVRVKMERASFFSRGQSYRLVPGMILQVSILTGHRSILEYLFSPLFNAMHAALGER